MILPVMKKNFLLTVLLLLLCVPSQLLAQGWTNPMTLTGENCGSWGDPYIMKYRGYYYLYVSAGDEKIYCWVTKDLINWTPSYTVCTDQTTAVAYAPEVIYWNGKFYMCTSPRGGGHYILTSDSPLGPFVHQTGNLGRDIDGSFFIDDDGRWYFYRAQNGGIHACEMPTPLTMSNDVNLGCCMSGQWTEGPCVFKRNGLYYLLYTGNHVWTDGYRIDYAMSNNGPLSGFRPQSEQNPILIDAETPWHKALGHGTAFVGPDLDTYYFCYHNLQDNKARRLLNFERIGWNGDKLMMTGPTCWEQDAPLVAANDYFEREALGDDWTLTSGSWQIEDADHLSQTDAEGVHTAFFNPCSYDDYTAEFTLKAFSPLGESERTDEGSFGVVFSYQDEANYSEALVNMADGKFYIYNYVDGAVRTTRSVALPDSFDPMCWHSIRLEKNGKRVRAYIDGMRKFQLSFQVTGGLVGYTTHNCKADFGYIAVSPFVDGNGILAASLPVPGMLAANLCVEASEQVTESSYTMTVGNSRYMKCTAGAVMKYNVNIQRDNVYNIGLRYRCTSNVKVRLLLDGEVLTDDVALKKSGSTVVVQTLRDVSLPGGHHQLSVEVVEGTVNIYEYNIKRGVENPHVMSDDFENGLSEEWGYREGSWNVVDGQLESTGRYGKMLMGGYEDIHLTDYTVECDINYTTGEQNGGIIFRVNNPSTGGADDNPVLGTDFIQGYFFWAGGNSVALGKQNYGWETITAVAANTDITKTHHMKVEVVGARIRCYYDDMENPAIDYTDNKPFISGRAGFRAHNSTIRFDNFKVTPMTQEEVGIEQIATPLSGAVGLYNLQGQRVQDSYKGVVIKNGMKQMIH